MRETPGEQLKLDTLGITLQELRQQDNHRWVGLVDWLSPENEFATKGDSGAMVFAIHGTFRVPLGVHLGKSNKWLNSFVFVSLEAFVLEQFQGQDLHFV
jgi:hypothetical protein